MIKGITGSDGVFVEGGNNSLPYHSANQGDSFSGALRLNGTDIQYYNNGVWSNLQTSYATVRMDSNIINWVRKKQQEESEADDKARYRERRAKEHPSLAKALDIIKHYEAERDREVREAIDQFNMLDKIIGEEQHDYPEELSVQSGP